MRWKICGALIRKDILLSSCSSSQIYVDAATRRGSLFTRCRLEDTLARLRGVWVRGKSAVLSFGRTVCLVSLFVGDVEAMKKFIYRLLRRHTGEAERGIDERKICGAFIALASPYLAFLSAGDIETRKKSLFTCGNKMDR